MITKKLQPQDILPLTCSRTGTCCHGKSVNLNPWELHCLASKKGISTKDFRDLYCEFGGTRLKFNGKAGWKNLSACSQYKEGTGCTVHLGRPLACRLYPLGRQKQAEQTHYIYEGTEFPCLEGCPEVVQLPQLSVGDYIKGQGAGNFELAQDEYLEVMQNLADVAFVLLLDTGLAESGDTSTLQRWKQLGQLSPEILTDEIEVEWLNLLMLPEIGTAISNPIDFAQQHNELLQAKAQSDFGALNSFEALHEASCLMMALALLLANGLGAKSNELADLWVTTAKGHGALE